MGIPGIYEQGENPAATDEPRSSALRTSDARAPISIAQNVAKSDKIQPVSEHHEPLPRWCLVGTLLAWVWAAGIVVGLLRLGGGYVALARFRHRLVPLSDPRQKLLVHEAVDAFGLRRLPDVYVSQAAAVPMSIGISCPAIVLPASMPREHDQRHVQAVLLHELAHIARRDQWVGLAQRIAGAMFWWNPLVHWANDLLSELREEICDNHVIEIQGEGSRLARVLVDLAAQVASVPLLPSTVGVLEPRLAGLTGRVTRLLNKERNMDTRMSFRWRVSVLTSGLFTLIAMAMVGGVRLADAEPVAKPVSPAEEAEEEASTTDGKFDFYGRVLDPEGKPLAGANIYVVFYTNFTHRESPAPKVRATSGTDGAFHFAMEEAEFDEWREAHPWGILDDVSFRNDTRIVGQAAGYGPIWLPAFQFDRSGQLRQRMLDTYPEEAEAIGKELEPVLKVVKDDVPLVGRVVDSRGRPISGANVRVAAIRPVVGEDLTQWLETAKRKDATVVAVMKHASVQRTSSGSFSDGAMAAEVLPQIMPEATTDADGRVCLRGVGRERFAQLRIEGPKIESAVMVFARTRPGETIRLPYNLHWNDKDITYYGANFEHVAQASVAIEGTVRDLESDAPLAGIAIQAYKLAGSSTPSYVAEYYFSAITNAEGRYRLTGMPVGTGNELLAVPPQGEPYLMSKISVDTADGKESVRADFELKRGVLIEGRVTDAKTDAGVGNCTVDYYVFRDNPHLDESPGFDGASKVVGPYMTDKEGRYAVPGLPGRGIVAVQLYSHSLSDYPLQAGVEGIPELNTTRRYPDKFAPAPLHIDGKHAVALVDLADDAKSYRLDFQLEPIPVLTGTVLDPEGKPLAGAHCRGATERGAGEHSIQPSSRFVPIGPRNLEHSCLYTWNENWPAVCLSTANRREN